MNKKINIYANEVVATPNKNMWGIFYEEINHSGDGGLYAEQIRNRSFADSNIPEGTSYADGKVQTKMGHVEIFDVTDQLPGWRVESGYGADASIRKTTEMPRNANCPEQMKLIFADKLGSGVRVINSGYWGFSKCEKGYHGKIILRAEGVKTLKVGLMRTNGTTITEKSIEGFSGEFKTFEFSLGGNTHTDARFFVEVTGCGEVYFDFVSLFPNDTFMGRKYGLRKDLVEMLADMKPGFVRFPGGCVVEGINLQNAIHWKNIIGPVEDRKGHWDLWSYRCTDGLGTHEFYQLCEDLNADAMYVCNCGMSCQARSSELADEEGIEWWLNDTLDAIEYAIGDVSTKWGAKRAENGHPEPFPLRYVEIGNENWEKDYHHRYRVFYKAIKEKYPHLELIADCRVPDAELEMVDDHFYTIPQTMPQIFDRYENEDRNGMKIYVGEYACNSEVGYGNILSAVSEACFMIGMERSADVVRIASYAPLFCNVNDRRWPVNLINFDKDTVFGLPSYYLQKLFADFHPEKVFKTDCIQDSANTKLFASSGILNGKLIVKVACFGPDDLTAEISISDVKVGSGEIIVLSGEKTTDTNSIVSPFEITPTMGKYNVSENFVHTFKSYSFTTFVFDVK